MERQLDATAADFLAELVSADAKSAIVSGEFTIEDYRNEYERQTGKKIARSTAESRLEKRVRNGELERRLARHNGRDVRAYRMVENEHPIQ